MTVIASPLQICGACLIALFASVAHAQEGKLPLWEAGVLSATALTPAYPGASERLWRATLLPFLIYRGDVLRVDRGGVEARVVKKDDFEIDVGFSGALPASSRDVAIRQGMEDLGTLLEFGPRAKITLNRPTPGSRVRLQLPVRAVLEFQGGVRQQGVTFEPEISYESRDLVPGWNMGTSVGLLFADQRLADYFYGVAPRYATAARPAYSAQPGLLATRLAFNASTAISPDLRVLAAVRYDSYQGAANTGSPLMQSSNGVSLAAVLVWTLGRSTQMVNP